MDVDLGHGGLGFLPVVVDARLAAPRGDEHTNAAASRREYADGDSLFEGEEEEQEDTIKMTLDTALPADNVGYKLLVKMGWTAGKGLGRNEDGIVEPIRSGVDEGVKLGLGKQAQDDFYMDADNVQRKRLETEIQANEGEERRERREALAEREARIKQEVTEIKKTFLCEPCGKQYNTAMELDVHLGSYDHHHKKRLVEMRAMTAERTRGERMKKEAKQVDREMAALQRQIQKAAAQKGGGAPPDGAPQPPPLPQESPPLPPPDFPSSSGAAAPSGWAQSPGQHPQAEASPPPPPPPPVTGGGISFGLGKKLGAGRGVGGPLARRGGAAAAAGQRPAAAAPVPIGGAFQLSDSEVEEGS